MLSKPITRYYRAPIAGFLMFVLFLNGLMIGYASSLGDKVVTTNSAWAKSANYDEIIKNRLQPSVQSSWTKIFNNGTVAGLALADINGDSANELIIAREQNFVPVGFYVEAYLGNGKLLWRSQFAPYELEPGKGVLAVGDIDGDKSLDIVVSSSRIGLGQSNAALLVYESNVQLKSGWPIIAEIAKFTGPTLVDLNHDKALEIVVGYWPASGSGNPLELRAYKANKELLWKVNGPTGWPQMIKPTVSDIDGDGSPEVITIFHSIFNSKIYIKKSDGSDFNSPFLLMYERISVPPHVVDLDGDGEKEIIVGTSVQQPDSGKVHIYDKDWVEFSGWPKLTGNQRLYDSVPVLADLNDDKKLEIIVNSKVGKVYAWQMDGTLLDGFPAIDSYPDTSWAKQPVVGDINDDKELDIVFNSADCRLNAVEAGGKNLVGYPRQLFMADNQPCGAIHQVLLGRLGKARQNYIIVAADGALFVISTSGLN